jgi:hypothetical protein
VAGAPAAIRHDRRCTLHHRLPVRIGHVGDQHVAGLHAIHFRRIVNHTHRTRADLLADRATSCEHVRLTLQLEAHLSLANCLALHRFGTCLQDENLAIAAVLAPLDVHWTLIMLFDDHRVLRELDHVFVGDGKAVALLVRYIDRLHATRFAGLRELHLDELRADRAADDRVLALFERSLEDVELVRIHGALNDRFAKTVARRDEHGVLEARFGIERKHHAGRAHVRANHALHARRQRDLSVRKSLVHAIRDSAVVIQRRKHVLHAIEDFVDADHVEIAFLLTGERCIRQVFSRCRRTHGERQLFGRTRLKRVETLADQFFEARLQRRVDDPLTDLLACFGKGFYIVHVEEFQTLGDALGQVVVMQEIAKRLRRGRKTSRHLHAGFGELADHFAE